MPITKMGASSGSLAGPGAKNSAREHRLAALDEATSVVGVVPQIRSSHGIAGRVLFERRRVVLEVLERLAEREVEVHAVLEPEVVTQELRAHRGDVVLAETEGLQVREAPVRLAE